MDIKRKIKDGIHVRRQRSTLNRDDGYKLPAIFNHMLSRDYSTAKNNARDMHVQEVAQEVDALQEHASHVPYFCGLPARTLKRKKSKI